MSTRPSKWVPRLGSALRFCIPLRTLRSGLLTIQWLESSCITGVQPTARQRLGLGIYWHNTLLNRGEPECPSVTKRICNSPGYTSHAWSSKHSSPLLQHRASSGANHQWIRPIQSKQSFDRSRDLTTNKLDYDRHLLTRHSYLWILW